MNLEDLRAVRSRERASDSLQEVRATFYEEVAEYIEELREQREQAADEADDPFGSEDVQALTDEIETAEQVAEAIYERRMGKLVKQASLAAAGMSGNTDGLTNEEHRLYEDLVERIEENKAHVLDVLAGEATPKSRPRDSAPEPSETESTNPTSSEPVPESGTEESSSAAAAMGDGEDVEEGSSDDSSDSEATTERKTVRITRDVGEIFGVDERQYTLEADDVVTLPEDNANPLIEKEAAEEV